MMFDGSEGREEELERIQSRYTIKSMRKKSNPTSQPTTSSNQDPVSTTTTRPTVQVNRRKAPVHR